MGNGRDLDYRRAQLQACARWQVLLAEIQVHVDLIARQRPTVPAARHQIDDPCVHDVQLHFRVRGSVRSTRVTAPPPVVANQSFRDIELGALQRFPLIRFRAADNHFDRPKVLWRVLDSFESGFECFAAKMYCGVHGFTPSTPGQTRTSIGWPRRESKAC